MTLPTPQAVIFDWDNTLVDTWPIINKALNATLAQFGKEAWTLEDTKARVSKSMRDSFPELFGANWQEAGKVYQQQYRRNHLSMLTPLPGAQEVLEIVQERSLPMLVVSNKKGHTLREEVAHLKWDDFFTAVIGSDDASRDKPHPDPVHLALEYADIKTGPHIWFIGDSEIDLETAAVCGCTPILFGDFAPARPEFSSTHYHGFPYLRHAHNHAALVEILLPKSEKTGIKASS